MLKIETHDSDLLDLAEPYEIDDTIPDDIFELFLTTIIKETTIDAILDMEEEQQKQEAEKRRAEEEKKRQLEEQRMLEEQKKREKEERMRLKAEKRLIAQDILYELIGPAVVESELNLVSDLSVGFAEAILCRELITEGCRTMNLERKKAIELNLTNDMISLMQDIVT